MMIPDDPPGLRYRLGARVLLMDDDNRVLLIHSYDAGEPERGDWWDCPGGGIDDGEDVLAACRREMIEETGIVLDEIGPCLWRRRSRFRHKGIEYSQMDTIHFARLRGEPNFVPRNLTAEEHSIFLGERWWTLEELRAASGKQFRPRCFAELLERVVNGVHEGITEIHCNPLGDEIRTVLE
ncbi:MAG TPA: NUDIX domain-containing protein [Candidatus Baltobacteraceae bacterium]|nr:NUDIX domain-containing protein [Candidatus Baltobacteraceae bacterium]